MKVKSGVYAVRSFFDGRILGKMFVVDGVISFDSKADEFNCDFFPPGPMTAFFEKRFLNRLNNPSKNPYVTEWSAGLQ